MPTATLNGYTHYWDDAGSGDVLVLVHGAASAGSNLSSHFDDLSNDFRVILPDLRGMGRSAHVESIPASAWTDDLLALLDHLSIDHAHLYGGSLGARVVLRFAIDHPERVESLILDAPIIANDPAGNAQLNASFDPENLSEERKARARGLHGDDWAAVMQNYFNIRNQPEVQEHLNLRPLCAQVTAPTLIMRGDRPDLVHPIAHSTELHELMPNTRLAILPNTGTAIHSSAPEAMRSMIREFISEMATVSTAS